MNKAEENFQILLDEFDFIRSYIRVAKVGAKTEREHIDTIIRCNQLDANCVGVIDDIVINDEDNIVIIRTETVQEIVEADDGKSYFSPECEYVVKEYHRKVVFEDGETLSTWVDQDEYNDIHYGKD